jgi:2-polyprenyl-3-methyl-5-hydroxy-6-metoxy-1,4-benzoquinol methylase
MNTLEFYEKNGDHYFERTKKIDMKKTRDKFLSYIPNKGYILDVGCGSGRDSKAFLEQDYRVLSIDGSQKMVELSSLYTGQITKLVDLNTFSMDCLFDGIWASAILLHFSKPELKKIIKQLKNSLKTGGVIFASFKYGVKERIEDNRFFQDFDEFTILELFNGPVCNLWVESSLNPGDSTKWINIIQQK